MWRGMNTKGTQCILSNSIKWCHALYLYISDGKIYHETKIFLDIFEPNTSQISINSLIRHNVWYYVWLTNVKMKEQTLLCGILYYESRMTGSNNLQYHWLSIFGHQTYFRDDIQDRGLHQSLYWLQWNKWYAWQLQYKLVGWMTMHEKEKVIFAESQAYIKRRGVVTGLTIIVM